MFLYIHAYCSIQMSNTLAKELSKDLWDTAEDLRGQIESSEYKYIVLGLLFIRDANIQHEKHRSIFMNEKNQYDEEYIAQNKEYINMKFKKYMNSEGLVYVPEDSRWDNIRSSDNLRKKLDDTMKSIEDENPKVKNQLPKRYQQSKINEKSLEKLINRFSNLGDTLDGGDSDYIGRVYEYFIKQFATESDGKGEFYTPEDIVQLLIKSINPSSGNIFDPCAGSGGIFVQSYKYAKNNDEIDHLAFNFKGQELNHSTVKLAKMNMLLHNMSNISIEPGNSLSNDKYPNLKADYVITNPPFNYSWGEERKQVSDNDVRFKYGLPKEGDANYAFIQHMLHHTRKGGTVGTVIANGALANQSEADIRKEITDNDLLDVVISLPGELFHSTPISVSIFIFSKGKGEYNTNNRTRKNETLFIDATNTYKKVSSSEKRLTDEHLNLISSTIRKYRGDWDGDIDKEDYEYIKDFCSVVKSEEIKNKGYNYNPGRYVSYTEETDDTPLEVRLPELKGKLESKFKQSRKTEDKIISKLNNLVEHGDSDE